MSTYAIKQTYVDYKTGESWTRLIKRRWKTWRGAEQVAQREFRWLSQPDGKTTVDMSSAEVIEVTP